MFVDEIGFIVSKKYIDSTEILPEPSVLSIPLWYKELKHSPELKTVKGCMPFLDTLTTGYIIKMPVDYHLTHAHHPLVLSSLRAALADSDGVPSLVAGAL